MPQLCRLARLQTKVRSMWLLNRLNAIFPLIIPSLVWCETLRDADTLSTLALYFDGTEWKSFNLNNQSSLFLTFVVSCTYLNMLRACIISIISWILVLVEVNSKFRAKRQHCMPQETESLVSKAGLNGNPAITVEFYYLVIVWFIVTWSLSSHTLSQDTWGGKNVCPTIICPNMWYIICFA